MLNCIGIIKPFKLQWVTIVEKSGAFCFPVDWFHYFLLFWMKEHVNLSFKIVLLLVLLLAN